MGDQFRDSSQRGLLLGEAFDLAPRFQVCYGRTNQFGELGDPLLGIGGQRVRLDRSDEQGAPKATFDDDRGADCRSHALAVQ